VHFNLFSPNLTTVLAMVFAAVFVYLIISPWLRRPLPPPTAKKKRPQPLPSLPIPWRWAIQLLLAAILGAFFVEGLVIHEYTSEGLPNIFWMALPGTLAVAALRWSWATRWYNRVLAGLLIVCGVLFGVLSVNNYYHYYPTLASALHSGQYASSGGGNQTVVRYSASKTGQQSSLEQSLQQLDSSSTKGKVLSIDVPNTASHFKARHGWLYVPAAAFSPEKSNLPVIVMLAGWPGGPNDWLNAGGASQTLDAFAAQHHGVAPIVAFIDNNGSQNNDTECVDSPRGNVETYLTTDVPTYLKANFDVSSNPANWAIGGLSDGGTCGIMLALRHPDVYHGFLDLGGDIGPASGNQLTTIKDLFNGLATAWQEHQPLYLLQQHNTFKELHMFGYFAVGSSDTSRTMGAVQTLYHQSTAAGLTVAYETTPGHHAFDVWKQQFQDALPWLSYQLGATACVTQCQ